MADFDFAAPFRTGNSQDGTSGPESNAGSEPGSGGPSVGGGEFKFSFDGSSGGAGDSQGRVAADAPVEKRRGRGRQAYPRTPDGRIIRPDGSIGPKSATNTGRSKGVDLNGFVPNDRVKLKSNIQSIHQAVATLTGVPIFLLTDQEGTALTDSFADVMDHCEWNITGGGPANIYIKCFVLGVTMFGIYKPRLDAISQAQAAANARPVAPPTPGEATPRGNGRMDFSADVMAAAAEVNKGTMTYQ